MKILALGDTHGRDDWKKIVTKESFDKVVFIGDYFDTHENISPSQQLSNFHNITEFAKGDPDSVVLLIGNHDYHYLGYTNKRYSGYQHGWDTAISSALHQAIGEGLMSMAFLDCTHLFTHAGVTNTWLESVGYKNEKIDDFINDLFRFKPAKFEYTPGENYNPYGDEICQTPIWVRPTSLIKDCAPYTQIVGHTIRDFISPGDHYFIDTLGTSGEYLIIDNGIFNPTKQHLNPL